MTEQSLPALADAIAEAAGDHRVVFDFDGFVIALRSNRAAVIAAVADYLSMFVARADVAQRCQREVIAIESNERPWAFEFVDWKRGGDKVGKKEQVADLDGGWIVRKVRTGMHFLLGSGRRVAVGPCEKNYIQLVNFLNVLFIADKLQADWTLCHAAGIAEGGRGLGLAGTSGAGKSTLALHAMNHELTFVSNDRLLIKRDTETGTCRMAGVPKHPRINPGTALHNDALRSVVPAERRQELLSMETDALWNLEEKYNADIETLFGGRWQLHATLVGFVILNWKRGADVPTEFRQIDFASRSDLWPALFKTPGPLHVGRDADGTERRTENSLDVDPGPYLEALADVPVFEVTGNVDFDRATGRCLELLGVKGN